MPIYKLLITHHCEPVQRCGWNGIKNGELLNLAEGRFDLFITSDQSLRYQQNLQNRRIAILQLSTNNLKRILVATSEIQDAVATIEPGKFRAIEIP